MSGFSHCKNKKENWKLKVSIRQYNKKQEKEKKGRNMVEKMGKEESLQKSYTKSQEPPEGQQPWVCIESRGECIKVADRYCILLVHRQYFTNVGPFNIF